MSTTNPTTPAETHPKTASEYAAHFYVIIENVRLSSRMLINDADSARRAASSAPLDFVPPRDLVDLCSMLAACTTEASKACIAIDQLYSRAVKHLEALKAADSPEAPKSLDVTG